MDTAYVEQYPHKLQVTAFGARNFIEMAAADKDYIPNSPIVLGFGLSIKNTVIGLYYGFITIDAQRNEKTETFDFQIHNYRKHLIVDLYIQQYKGFANADIFYPNLSVARYGAETTYIFNGNKFSTKAAFEQTERQRKSVGSWVLGASAYFTQIKNGQSVFEKWDGNINNLQLGANAGYVYSWVINPQWLMSGMMTTGIALGNEFNNLENDQIRIYPASLVRFAWSYNKPTWSLAISTLYKFDWTDQQFFRSGYVQLSFVKRFESIRFWKK
ncbi:hypothetical protein FACS189467_0050 [Bacteroidia bacterium]|nr:hypothetical protein FACS189467_0050 [Bacteroidia bacterium]